MERLCLIICCFWLLQAEAQFTQRGRTWEYNGRNQKTAYTSPVSISFQGCSSSNNDKNTGNLSLKFPNAKAGNVVSCTEVKTSDPNYVIFNRNDFEIWTLGDRALPVVLCKKSKIDSYVALYTKAQMDACNAKYEVKMKELNAKLEAKGSALNQSESEKQELQREMNRLKREQADEIKEIKENALIFAYIDEEKLDSLQYEQHKCILNNDIEGAVEIGKQIDFKNNISKQLSNFEKSIAKTQEFGLKLFQKAEALYLHISNCEMLSVEKDSLKEDYDVLIKCYRTLIEQYPNNFKCTEDTYNKTKAKLGKILYKYAIEYLNSTDNPYNPADDNDEYNIDSLTYCYMKEASSCKNLNAIFWIVEHGKNYDERKLYARELLDGFKNSTSDTLTIQGVNYSIDYSFYDIKDICESFPDFHIEDADKILYYSIVSDSTVSVAHFHSKNPQLSKLKIPQSVAYQGKKYIVTQIGTSAFADGSYGGNYVPLKCGSGGACWETTNNYFGQDDDTASVSAVIDEEKMFHIGLPKTIKYVGAFAFSPSPRSSVRLKIKGIPTNLKILRFGSFLGCITANKSISIPAKVEIIENDAFPADDHVFSFSLPCSLKELQCFNGYNGGAWYGSYGKIVDINGNPNFRLIDGALYTADSSHVYLGTVGHTSKILHITRNMEIDEDFLWRLHYSTRESIDSICFDDRNPYCSYYDHCFYTKQMDTLLFILPSVNNVRLSANLKYIATDFMPDIQYEIPNDMPIESIKSCLDIFSSFNRKFELNGKEYRNEETNSGNQLCASDFFDLILKDNNNDPKLLGVQGLFYLEEDKYCQACELLDLIKSAGCSSSDYYRLLSDSCVSYKNRMDTYIEELHAIDFNNNHEKFVETGLKIRDCYNNRADYLNTEEAVLDAYLLNYGLGHQEAYSDMRHSLAYLEKAIPYALKLVEEFDKEKYRYEVSDFYASLSFVALWNEADRSKPLIYAQKSIELNPNNVAAYEVWGEYVYRNEGDDKNAEISDIITKVEKIDPDYSKSKDHRLYQLLNSAF